MKKNGCWRCPLCEEEADPRYVTVEETHSLCGEEAEWIEIMDKEGGQRCPELNMRI